MEKAHKVENLVVNGGEKVRKQELGGLDKLGMDGHGAEAQKSNDQLHSTKGRLDMWWSAPNEQLVKKTEGIRRKSNQAFFP
jgi:hypothetical protein